MSNQPHIERTDEELLNLYRVTSNNEWLGMALQRYTLLLLGVAMKYLKDKEQAQDAVQQVFLKALTHLPKDEIYNFKGWLYILMRNHCFQSLRDKDYKADDSTLGTLKQEETDHEELMQKEYTLEQMNNALVQLAEEQKNSLTLFYLQKMTYQQIMDKTGYTFIQVKSYIQNGKRNLKALLLKKIAERNND